MDFQKMIYSMNDMQAHDRGNYHLTYGQLIKALKSAPAEAVVDERIKGIGSWRGSYIEIAIFTEDSGASWEDEKYTGDYGNDYKEWEEKHSHGVSELPTNANELGELLFSLIGKDFVGWKGGNFTIEEYKPLWLCPTPGESGNTAIIGIDKDLKLITKELDQ